MDLLPSVVQVASFIYGVIGFPVMPEGAAPLVSVNSQASQTRFSLPLFSQSGAVTVSPNRRRCALLLRFLVADAALMPMACFIGFPFSIIMVFYGKADFKCL